MDVKRKERQKLAVMAGILAVAAFFGVMYRLSPKESAPFRPALSQTAKGTKATIVIDPGHGGFDPGKVGVNHTLEKDINLAISKKLNAKLAASGYTVYMTRTTDEALCQGNESSKKLTDMKNRVALIEETKPDLVVSIHQNSFSAGTKGAQVFYHTNSDAGKRLAGILQQTIREAVGDDNHRVEKANDSYYMLRKVTCPLVIVECGFLSNPEEEALLNDEKYQKKMADGIAEGIENFLYK